MTVGSLCNAAGSIEMNGRHLTGCKVIALTPDGSANLPYVSHSERVRSQISRTSLSACSIFNSYLTSSICMQIAVLADTWLAP